MTNPTQTPQPSNISNRKQRFLLWLMNNKSKMTTVAVISGGAAVCAFAAIGLERWHVLGSTSPTEVVASVLSVSSVSVPTKEGKKSKTQQEFATKKLEMAQQTQLDAYVDIGRTLFKDERLSTSGKMACATCHVEGFGHADKPGVQLPLGGAQLNTPGNRGTPTNRYLNKNPAFYIDENGNAFGGFTWDGRGNDHTHQA